MANTTDVTGSSTNTTEATTTITITQATTTTTTTSPVITAALDTTSAAPTDNNNVTGIIAGSVVGGCAVIIIIIVAVLLWRRCRQSRKIPPPILPDPHARIIFRESQPSSYRISSGIPSQIPPDIPLHIPPDIPLHIPPDIPSDIPSDIPPDIPDSRNAGLRRKTSQVSAGAVSFTSSSNSGHSLNPLRPKQQTWKVQEPVIHSQDSAIVEERVSYMFMREPSRPISMSPPSPPSSTTDIHPQFNEQRPPPAPCKSPSGYVNVSQKKIPSSSEAGDVSPTPTEPQDEYITSMDIFTPIEEDENYENCKDIVFTSRTIHSNSNTHKTVNLPVSNASIVNTDDPESSQPARDRSCSLYENIGLIANGSFQNQNTNSNSSSSSENDLADPAGNKVHQSSYVNVEKYKKSPPQNELPKTEISELAAAKLSNHDVISENKPQTKPKVPIISPKPKQIMKTSNSSPDINAYKHGNKINIPTINNKGDNNTQHETRSHGIPRVVPPSDTSWLRPINEAGEIKSTSKNNNSPLNKLLVAEIKAGLNKPIKNQAKADESSAVMEDSRTNMVSEDTVYQHSIEASSHPKNKFAIMPHRDLSRNEAATAQRKVETAQLELGRKADKASKATVRYSVSPTGDSGIMTQNVKFGSSPNVGSSGNILEEMRSKLKKVN